MSGERTWTPLLGGAAAERARLVLDDIASAVVDRDPPLPGLLSGAVGHALFLSYYATAFGDARAEARATELLERTLGTMLEVSLPPGLGDGLAGIGWVIEHLAGIESAEDDPNVAIDDALVARLATETWDADYELVFGLAGLGVYGLERLPRAGAVVLLERIVTHLERLAQRGDPGLTWHTPVRLLPPHQAELEPAGYHNLGLAHGVAGVAAVLARIVAAGIAGDRARRLLDGAVTWLLARRLPRSDARYSSWIGSRERRPTRSAWCYGDPGVAIALLAAARAVNEPAWEQAAIELARGVIGRPREDRGVVDAGLCHGAFGLAQIFGRFFHVTGDPEFRRAAVEQIEDGLAFRRPGRGVAGFAPFALDRDLPEDDAGLLTGAAGIGLALLAACTDLEPAWDRVLLFDVPESEVHDER